MSSRPRSLIAVALALQTWVGPAGAAAGDPVSAPPAQAGSSEWKPRAGAGAPGAPSHTGAWIAIGAGLALTGFSFVLANQADRAYQQYKGGTDPAALGRDYDRAVRSDRWATATLLAGQAAFALGLYWRLVRHPRSASASARGESDGLQPPRAAPVLRPVCSASSQAARVGLALEF